VFEERLVSLPSGVVLNSAMSSGPADRSLLALHGGPDWDHTYLREPLSRIAEHFRLVLPDFRGCGRSSTGLEPTQYNAHAVVADLLALLDELGGAPATVLGFSYGGLIAQRLLVASPERVRRLIIASSSVLPVPADAFEGWEVRAERIAAEAAVWREASSSGPELTAAAALAGARANVWREESLPEYLRRLTQVRFTAEWLGPWRAGILPSPRLADPVAQINATGRPVLLLHGEQDMIFPAELARSAASLLARASAVVIPDAGHMAHIDQPDAWIGAVQDFLEQGV
jgi:pimeloyl-ACP methyl ester carboxylesterase